MDIDIRIISLIFVVVSFAVLFTWVFLPKNRDRLEAQGRMAIEDEGDNQ